MLRFIATLCLLTACGTTPPADVPVPDPAPVVAPEPPPAPAARAFFVSPADGATVASPVKLVFGVEGMEVRAAGELVEKTGHHHVIIGPAGISEGEMVPKDETHIHFGKGQTEAEIELPKGEHKLTMQFADGNHMSYGKVLASTITITVE